MGSDDGGEDEAALHGRCAALTAPALPLIGLDFGRVLAARVHADPGHHVFQAVLLDEGGDREPVLMREGIELQV